MHQPSHVLQLKQGPVYSEGRGTLIEIDSDSAMLSYVRKKAKLFYWTMLKLGHPGSTNFECSFFVWDILLRLLRLFGVTKVFFPGIAPFSLAMLIL